MPIHNYNLVSPNLCMGGAVVDADGLFEEFDAVVLCAEEWQPEIIPPENDRSKEVFRLPLIDVDSPVAVSSSLMGNVAKTVAKLHTLHREGRRILITCMAGRNRSGIVTALLLRKILGVTSDQAIEMVRAARGPHALSNPTFVRYLKSIR